MPRETSASRLPRPVWLLGWISLATDAATEAVYPLLPFFLTTVLHASAASLGVVEGVAEAVNSVLKVMAGRVADRSPNKRPLLLLGYSVSSFARPFIAVATTWTQVLSVRVLDRVGKGVRSAPRDAMLAGWATPDTRGKVFGVHQGMDHIGAIVGPTLAFLFLLAYPDRYRTLFSLTIVPGAIAVILILFVREPPRGEVDPMASAQATGVDVQANPAAPSRLPRDFTRFMCVLALFTLGNSTDAFLLLRLTSAAGTVHYVPLMWAALHVVKASVSMVAGGWSDRIGRRTIIASGWLVYAVVYGGFALSATLPALLGWFLLYGCYFGFAEGTEKALVADLAPTSMRGLAFGIYNAVTGLGALAASITFGLVWNAFGPTAAFGLGSSLALAATLLLTIIRPTGRPSPGAGVLEALI